MSKFAIDSSVWIEYFSNPTEELTRIIEDNELVTSVIAIAELADKFMQQGLRFNSTLLFIEEKSKIVDLTIDLAVEASKIKKRVRKTRPKFGLADAIHLATARNESAELLTMDNDFSELENARIIK